MNELPIFVRQGLAIGLLAVALLFGWSLVLHPLYLATKQSVEELDDARFELQRLAILAEDAATTTPDAILSELDALQTQLFAMRTASDTDAHFITAVDQLIRSSGVRLLQLKAGVPSRAGILTRYTVDINSAGHESDIARLLSGIEQNRPLLVIDHAALLSQGNPFADFDTAPELSVQLRLSGFGADINITESQGRHNAR
ncbi:type II secretion system protein GspM [Sedimenticola selenatireducens]|uniref:General secretion pathway protein GspM n=1 Tax=Sedimenticola selenatireducens TaxID=191960 RepID=A0A2N6CW16_9GAMM|nr:type II secretion system protein GspM [Sedimenticola selenatireducens]PLX61408.1 MAG: hypothetical protein C0630_10780 [Sedimenticola selenatireducens]